MSLSVARPYRKPPISLPPFPFFVATSEHLSLASSAQLIKDTINQPMASNVTGDILSMSIGEGQWGYFLTLVSNGSITFTDINGGAGTGGWDGAKWPADGSIGSGLGPVVVTLDYGNGPEDWYLYRTDFPHLGNKAWRLSYARSQV